MTEVQEYIKSLIAKASKADKSEDAMRFSQAATNAANALMCLLSVPKPNDHKE